MIPSTGPFIGNSVDVVAVVVAVVAVDRMINIIFLFHFPSNQVSFQATSYVTADLKCATLFS